MDPGTQSRDGVPRRRDAQPRPDGPMDLRIGAEVMVAARVCAVAFLAAFVGWVDLPHRGLVAGVLGGAAVGHLLWWWRYVSRGHPLTYPTALATLLTDTVGIGIAMLLTGGTDSPVVLIWSANVAVAAIWLGVRRSIPVMAVVVAFTIVAVIVDPGGRLELDEIQYATFAIAMLALVATHGGIVAARQREAIHRIAAAEAQAMRDPLTGLANRRAFEEALPSELDRAQRYGRPLTLLMIDLDDFKRVNDTQGHLAGDAVLVDVATQLQREMRAADLVVRLGGEEFVMVLPETDGPAAHALAERLRERVLVSPAMDGVTVSIGLATFPAVAQTAVELVQAADEALYTAKRCGKNRTVVAAGGRGAPAAG